jgi:dienelactone hydrolase
LASWGYIVAIPNFPDEDIEVRASDVGYLFSYLEGENDNSASPFFQKIDTQRFALTGHSLGGVNTMMLAARDARVKMAGVALDPAGGPAVFGNSQWDYEAEAPEITAPLLVIGGQAGFCNSSAQYNAMYPAIGATHKAKFVIANGGHCDFMDTDEPLQTTLCSLLCGGQFSQERLKLAERYSAAWFNYYLRLDTDYYTYLYGGKAEEDVQAGRITRDVQTAPRDVAARSRFRAVELNWTLYNHPIIAGYNIYRSEQSGHYSSAPYAQVGRASSYMDTNATPGQLYFYVLRSRDAAGNEHQPSVEVSAVAKAQAQHTIHLPLLFRSD